MSRIGKLPISIPANVTVAVSNDNVITVKGPKGELSQKIDASIAVVVEDGTLTVKYANCETYAEATKQQHAYHGLYRALINNMVIGVSEGFSKSLTIIGTGYRAALSGKKLVLNMGYSHPVTIGAVEGVKFEVPSQTEIIVSGIDKQKVGQIAAVIRSVREPEPYGGKGIMYKGERVRRKVGKKAGKK